MPGNFFSLIFPDVKALFSLKSGFVFFVAISLSWLAYLRTDGFAPWKIESPFVCLTEAAESEEVQKILSQPFHYLGKGRQAFVFESLDGQYVLKLFNKTYFQMPWYSFLFYEKERAKREKRRAFFQDSYSIAFQEFGDGIVYLHLGPSFGLPCQKIRGPAHSAFQIDYNKIPFVLQRKGGPFYPMLEAIYEREGLLGLKREIDIFLAQVAKRIERQIADGDNDVEHNWGYIDGNIFHLDPGRLFYDPNLIDPQRKRQEWHTATFRFVRWLKVRYPEAAQYLEHQMQTL